MTRIGIDTSVVLRLLIGEPADQATAAKAFVEQCYYAGTAICVSDLVMAEAYHALISHYDVPKREAIHTLRAFLSSPMVTALGYARAVIANYDGTGPGLVDRLIRRDLLAHAEEVKTFDRDFTRLEQVTLLE